MIAKPPESLISVHIESEIDPLRHVVVHRPGDEIARMTQHELDLLLFDDILSPAETVREHDLFTEILRGAGAEVIDIATLLERAIASAPAHELERLLVRVTDMAGVRELTDTLLDWSPARLAHGLVCGVYWREIDRATTSLVRIRAELDDPDAMALRPTPNLMFMRDPGMAIGRFVVLGHMATEARAREPHLVAFALRHSGRLAEPQLLFEHPEHPRPAIYRSIEGGDVLVLSAESILVGCSERTSAQTIERLAHEALFESCPRLERLHAVLMPEQRSVMHLDTILTHIDRQLFVGHQPLLEGEQALRVVRLERDRPPAEVKGASVVDVLREELGAQTQLVPCGGSDRLHQEREQWTDGANALTLAPGRIILYARNVFTIRALADYGFEEVSVHWVQPPEQRAELIAEGMQRERTIFSFSGSELSRARGGGRCLTMPLRRGD